MTYDAYDVISRKHSVFLYIADFVRKYVTCVTSVTSLLKPNLYLYRLLEMEMWLGEDY